MKHLYSSDHLHRIPVESKEWESYNPYHKRAWFSAASKREAQGDGSWVFWIPQCKLGSLSDELKEADSRG